LIKEKPHNIMGFLMGGDYINFFAHQLIC